MMLPPPNILQPRPYQSKVVESLWSFDYHRDGGIRNPLAVLPTGTGKSLIPALLMQKAMLKFPNQRMLILTHVKELVEQNYKAILKLWPTAPVGIYSAGLDRKEAHAPIVFGSVQSVKNAIKYIGPRDVLFIDEAHLVNLKASSMYQSVITQLRQYNPYMPVIGLTATHYRMGQGMLTDSSFDKDGNVVPPLFTDVAYDLTGLQEFNQLIEDRYLCELVPKKTHVEIDTSEILIQNGEFNQTQLQTAVLRQGVTAKALNEAVQLASDRKAWIVFCSGIPHCYETLGILQSMGISCCVVHSNRPEFKMSKEDRTTYVNAFKQRHFRAIISNNILTTGFDDPQVDCIIDLRPTSSTGLHVQKYGRGTRPYFHPSYSFEQLRYLEHRIAAIQMGGKRNCLVLDFAGNTARLGPINDPTLPKRKGKGGTGEAPIKICDNCGGYNYTVARFCCDCGAEFIFKTKIKTNASTEELIRKVDEPNVNIVKVDSMHAYAHQKKGSTKKMRVQYFCGFQMYNVWLGFEPDEKGFVKHKAHEWWRQHSRYDCPQSTDEALERFSECRQTSQLKLDTAGEYPTILEFLF